MWAGHLGAGQQLVQQPGVGAGHRVGGVVVLQLGAVQRVRLQPDNSSGNEKCGQCEHVMPCELPERMQEPGHAHAGDRCVLWRQDPGSVGGQQGGHLGHRQRGRQPRQPQPEVRVRRHHGPEHRRGRRAAHVRRVAHVAPEARGGGALADGAGEVAQGRREAGLGEGGVRGGGRGGHGDGGRGGGQDWGRMELSTSRARCSWLASLSGIWK